MSGFLAEVDFRGRCASESLVGSMVGVVVKAEANPLLEVSKHQGLEFSECELTFQASPQPFEKRNGAPFSHGAEPGENTDP